MNCEQHWPEASEEKLGIILNIFTIQLHREANLTSPFKGQTSTYNNYFSNFGRTLVLNDLCKDTAPKHPRFW